MYQRFLRRFCNRSIRIFQLYYMLIPIIFPFRINPNNFPLLRWCQNKKHLTYNVHLNQHTWIRKKHRDCLVSIYFILVVSFESVFIEFCVFLFVLCYEFGWVWKFCYLGVFKLKKVMIQEEIKWKRMRRSKSWRMGRTAWSATLGH